MTHSHDIVICGAGIAGISAAYHLTAKHGIKDVLIVDERAPLSLTSDKSTEAYRNWWPDAAMVGMMNRSIDLLEEMARETGNIFNLNRRGYVYATADESNLESFIESARKPAMAGAGELRVHQGSGVRDYVPHHAEGFDQNLTGADLILDQNLIRKHFPYLNENTIAILHARRCGWFSAQTLGMWMLEQAKVHGAKLLNEKVTGAEVRNGRVEAVHAGEKVNCKYFVNAGGPLIKNVGSMIGIDLPIHHELHTKISFADSLGCIPRDAPMLIWNDAQTPMWSDDEQAMLREDDATKWMTGKLAAGAHTRPEGAGESVLMLWDTHSHPVDLILPPKFDESFPDLVMRGMATMIPSLQKYFDRPPKPFVDGGYYTKTKENRPLVGSHGVDGAYLIGAFSGYGLMCAPACGELLAAHITESSLPSYAKDFELARYENAEYAKGLESLGESGQL
jgi:glycine/D-amino acid oxidase-like deaminating enzyme